eukprot:762015-Hanusia_phi.AAC.2
MAEKVSTTVVKNAVEERQRRIEEVHVETVFCAGSTSWKIRFFTSYERVQSWRKQAWNKPPFKTRRQAAMLTNCLQPFTSRRCREGRGA